MDVKTLTGEELAQILNQAYQNIIVEQNNITAILSEIQRRKNEKEISYDSRK